MALRFIHRASVSLVLLFGARAANATCVINGVRPTVALPTMDAGQEFSFIATADCEKLRFRVPGTTFVAIPKAGPDRGTKDRTYKVVLTESEWSSLVDEGDMTFTWSIIGTTSAGVTTRVTTTNELKVESVTIDLSMADAKLVGEADQDVAGVVLSGAGDVDGDGHDDLLIASGNDEGGEASGAAYLVLGPVSGTVDLSMADAKLVAQAEDYLNAVAGVGDVNGDGLDDLAVGAIGNDEAAHSAGVAYVMLGPVTGTVDLSLADAKLVGKEDDNAGYYVVGAGDIDDDGLADVMVVPENDVIYLMLAPMSGMVDLSTAAVEVVGEEMSGSVPHTAAGAGDVDGDGRQDLLFGKITNDEGADDAGAAYVVLGPVTGTFDLALSDAKLLGESESNLAGCDVAGAGDVDDDGHDDLLIGSIANAAYLVSGPVSGTRDLSLADAKIVGDRSYPWTGTWVSAVGDVDGDGHDDILVGSEFDGARGAAHVVLGPVTGTFDVSRADAKLVGEARGDHARRVASAGDVDADGRPDILVGAGWNDEGGSDAGAAYLVYGGGLF